MRTFLSERKLRFNQLAAQQFFMETLTRGLIKMRLLTCIRRAFMPPFNKTKCYVGVGARARNIIAKAQFFARNALHPKFMAGSQQFMAIGIESPVCLVHGEKRWRERLKKLVAG
jgi:hypothetical protein